MQHVNYEEQQKTENEEASNSAVLIQLLTAHSKNAIEASPQRYIGQSFQNDDEITVPISYPIYSENSTVDLDRSNQSSSRSEPYFRSPSQPRSHW